MSDRILTTRGAMEGERKQVTVLFADVKGSMDLASSTDPETWHRIMDRFFAILASGVHRFEGTVNQYTGDGIMALFGAPIAHEDHAQRACYAALQLTKELRGYADELRMSHGLSFSVRIGLNSGDVVVGKIGDDLRMDYTAQGQTVGLAARMEQLAEPGRAYLTEHTAALISGYFRLRDLGRLRVKGVAEPVGVYELEGAGPLGTRFDRSRAHGLSRFVGRESEVRVLDAALARAIEGAGQVVGIVGEAGVGKSRLCFESVENARARGVSVYEAHSPAVGRNVPFLTVLQMLRAYFSIGEQDSDEEARRKIAGITVRLDEKLTDALPDLFEFMGVPDPERPPQELDPDTRQRRLLGITRSIVQAGSRRQATIFFFDDAQWMDAGSQAFLEQWVEAVASTRTMLLLNFRPEYHASWMSRSYYQQLPIAALGDEAIAELLDDLLGCDPSVAGLKERIRERTAGNPFFMEETVRALTESGVLAGTRGGYQATRDVQEISIPATVQAVLAARIDRLPSRDKRVLQTASVVGKEFCERILSRVVELPDSDLAASLQTLTDAEFVYERVVYPHAELAFRHPLTQEVAYRSQLAEQRARLHGSVANAIAEVYADKLNERAALLAHHWQGAGNVLEAARWNGRAAEWVRATDPATALDHWRNVRALLAEEPPSIGTRPLLIEACIQILDLGLRFLQTDSNDPGFKKEAAAVLAQGQALSEEAADTASLARLLGTYAYLLGTRGEFEEAVSTMRQAQRLVAGSADLLSSLTVANLAVNLWDLTGRPEEGVAVANGIVDRVRGEGAPEGHPAYIRLLAGRASSLLWMGSLEAARADLEQALKLAREHRQLEHLGVTHVWFGWLEYWCGDIDASLRRCREALELGERTQSMAIMGPGTTLLGVLNSESGNSAEAVSVLEALLDTAQQAKRTVFVPLVKAGLAEALLGQGEADRAVSLVREASELARGLGAKLYEIRVELTRARILLVRDGLGAREEIESVLSRASRLVEETGAQGSLPSIEILRAELASESGDAERERAHLLAAQRLYVAMGARRRAEKVQARL